MNILGTQYTLQNKAFEIYVSGCNGNPHCEGCHNPESWVFNNGEIMDDYILEKIAKKIKEFDGLIDNIMIFGGEPLDQDLKEIEYLLQWCYHQHKTLWIFTRYSLDEVPQFVKYWCDYIKCGPYIKSLCTDDNVQYGIKLSTSNQKIYKKGLDY